MYFSSVANKDNQTRHLRQHQIRSTENFNKICQAYFSLFVVAKYSINCASIKLWIFFIDTSYN